MSVLPVLTHCLQWQEQHRLLPAPTFPLGRRSPNTHRKQWPVGHRPGNSRSRSSRWNSRAEAAALTPSLATWLREIGVKSENTKLNSCQTKPLLLWLQVFPTLLEEIGARRKECFALGNLPKFQQDPSLLGFSGEHLHWKHCDSKSCVVRNWCQKWTRHLLPKIANLLVIALEKPAEKARQRKSGRTGRTSRTRGITQLQHGSD